MEQHLSSSTPAGTFKQLPYWRLRALFREHGMFDSEVAQAAGIAQPTFSRRMNGTKPWSADEIEAVCRLFEISQEAVGWYFFPALAQSEKHPAK